MSFFPIKTMKNQINIVLSDLGGLALIQGVCSGISIAASIGRGQGRKRGYFFGGTTRYDQWQRPVQEDTLFDIASLTKPLCTTLCTLALLEAGAINLATDCCKILDIQSLRKDALTVGHILNHCTGLPAYHPFYADYVPKPNRAHMTSITARIIAEPLINCPGTHSVYSDFGFILLGQVIEKIGKAGLDQIFNRYLAQPLHLEQEIQFRPCSEAGNQTRDCLSIAATENCPWRNTVIQGEVHDEHCWLMGGVAGHAGLFATARGVLQLCESILDCWQNEARHPVFTQATLKTALEWKSSCGGWRLGFDSPSFEKSSTGQFFSPRSVGHLGFTGTSFWIDPERDLVVVLLTNRVHPSRENLKIRTFRPYFHDQLWENLGKGKN